MGEDVGTPDHPCVAGVAFFGPVITRKPVGEAADDSGTGSALCRDAGILRTETQPDRDAAIRPEHRPSATHQRNNHRTCNVEEEERCLNHSPNPNRNRKASRPHPRRRLRRPPTPTRPSRPPTHSRKPPIATGRVCPGRLRRPPAREPGPVREVEDGCRSARDLPRRPGHPPVLLGFNQIGVIMIIVTVLTCGLGAIWGLVEGILIWWVPVATPDATRRPLRIDTASELRVTSLLAGGSTTGERSSSASRTWITLGVLPPNSGVELGDEWQRVADGEDDGGLLLVAALPLDGQHRGNASSPGVTAARVVAPQRPM